MPSRFGVRARSVSTLLSAWIACSSLAAAAAPRQDVETLDAAAIAQAAGAEVSAVAGGVLRIGWARDDVPVEVDGVRLPPPAGLGSWAGFQATARGAMVMGDTVVFEDEVDAAMDAAFAAGLDVSALHNHFFYDRPKVYFMHLGGHGQPTVLAAGVKAVWDAIKAVRAAHPTPAVRFGGEPPVAGALDAAALAQLVGHPATLQGGVAKISVPREARMHGVAFGGAMGLSTWAAFSGSDARAAIDGDFAMTAAEVPVVLRALRRAGLHVVALHNHMIGEQPAYYFTHYWGTGPAADLARAFRAVLDAQAAAGVAPAPSGAYVSNFDALAPGPPGAEWVVEATNPGERLATWEIVADPSAPSAPHALRLADVRGNAGQTYNLCRLAGSEFLDGTLEVALAAVTGDEDRGGGLFWRARDRDNYYVARWNPLEDNFRAYHVEGGRRVQIASATVRADPAAWHTLRIEQRGARIQGWLDGALLIDVEDATHTAAGAVGLWTKADAATSFDDLTIRPAARSR